MLKINVIVFLLVGISTSFAFPADGSELKEPENIVVPKVDIVAVTGIENNGGDVPLRLEDPVALDDRTIGSEPDGLSVEESRWGRRGWGGYGGYGGWGGYRGYGGGWGRGYGGYGYGWNHGWRRGYYW